MRPFVQHSQLIFKGMSEDSFVCLCVFVWLEQNRFCGKKRALLKTRLTHTQCLGIILEELSVLWSSLERPVCGIGDQSGFCHLRDNCLNSYPISRYIFINPTYSRDCFLSVLHLTSINTIISRFIHVAINCMILCFLTVEWYSIRTKFLYSVIYSQSLGFQFGDIENSATMNMKCKYLF